MDNLKVLPKFVQGNHRYKFFQMDKKYLTVIHHWLQCGTRLAVFSTPTVC